MPDRILVVDDEPAMLAALTLRVSAAGHDVVPASSAEEARDAATKLPPDLAILDIRLADGVGTDLASDLRRRPGLAALPILFLTASPPPDSVVHADDLPPTRLLRKPYAASEVLATIDELLPHTA